MFTRRASYDLDIKTSEVLSGYCEDCVITPNYVKMSKLLRMKAFKQKVILIT